MKTTLFFLTISLFSICTYSQSINKEDKNNVTVSRHVKAKNLATKNIVYYHVREIISSGFGGYETNYKVSDISLINTTDLGPNNKRIVTTSDGKVIDIAILSKEKSKSVYNESNTTELAIAKKPSQRPISKSLLASNLDVKKINTLNKDIKSIPSKDPEVQKLNIRNNTSILTTNLDAKVASTEVYSRPLLIESTPIENKSFISSTSKNTTVTPTNLNTKEAKYTPNQLNNYNSSSTINEVAENKDNKSDVVEIKNNQASNSKKFVMVNKMDTYEKIAEKGYKSIEIYKKLADAFYFEGQYSKAVKWYSELFSMTNKLDSKYYYHFAYSLKETGNIAKSNEIMLKMNLN